MDDKIEEKLRDAALDYHRRPTPGKISVTPTKGLTNQWDLSLAYSPGVAYACLAIKDNPQEAATLTSRANLVAVVTNGTAVLGLGNIGALAGKPVMEGKGCLFKAFAGIDVFDLEINETDPDKIVEIVAAMEGASNRLISVEDLSEEELQVLRIHYKRLAEMASHDSRLTESHSVVEAESRHAIKRDRRRNAGQRIVEAIKPKR